jgi:hypothetical protein
LTAASAPTVNSPHTAEAEPGPPRVDRGGPEASAGAPRKIRRAAGRRVAKLAIRRISAPALSPPLSRSNRIAAGTIGTLACARKPAALLGQPRLRAGGGIEPKASRPTAQSRRCPDRLRWVSRAVSRVPGPPPRTSMEATAGAANTTAVAPEASAASSAWPTRTPGTSVMRLRRTLTSLAFRWRCRVKLARERPLVNGLGASQPRWANAGYRYCRQISLRQSGGAPFGSRLGAFGLAARDGSALRWVTCTGALPSPTTTKGAH